MRGSAKPEGRRAEEARSSFESLQTRRGPNAGLSVDLPNQTKPPGKGPGPWVSPWIRTKMAQKFVPSSAGTLGLCTALVAPSTAPRESGS